MVFKTISFWGRGRLFYAYKQTTLNYSDLLNGRVRFIKIILMYLLFYSPTNRTFSPRYRITWFINPKTPTLWKTIINRIPN